MQAGPSNDETIQRFESQIDDLFARGHETAPNLGVTLEMFKASVTRSLARFLQSSDTPAADSETTEFLNQLQIDDLFLALGCAAGNERAWWEFDQQHRAHLERVAHQLAKTDVDAHEVIDCVYVELYGTRVVDGERVSKFATYSGRGSLRGWLRTVIWHSLVDLHRASHDELSLDELTENVGEGAVQATFALPSSGGERAMIDDIARDRYRTHTLSAIEAAFTSLEDHEKLLLLYYHNDQLRLREIAALVEQDGSPLQRWFQRRAAGGKTGGRIHESTVMRWLEKSYAKILTLFKTELSARYGLGPDEVEICLELATEDLADKSLFTGLMADQMPQK